MNDFTIVDIDLVAPLLARAGVTLTKDGEMIQTRLNAADVTIAEEWWTGHPETDVGADYEAKCVVTSGSGFGGSPYGSWEWLGTDLAWYQEENDGISTGTLSVSIRTAVGAIPQDDCVVSTRAEAFIL